MDLKEIKSLIRLLQETDLTEIEVEEKGRKIRVRKDQPPPVSPSILGDRTVASRTGVAPLLEEAPPLAPPGAFLKVSETIDEPLAVISSPIVGTFYKTHAPGAEPYVKIGDQVKKGQILCIVEAMKLMNEIESDMDGTIVAICVEDKSPVEFGQPLFKIEPFK